jgi:hypothetical protein
MAEELEKDDLWLKEHMEEIVREYRHKLTCSPWINPGVPGTSGLRAWSMMTHNRITLCSIKCSFGSLHSAFKEGRAVPGRPRLKTYSPKPLLAERHSLLPTTFYATRACGSNLIRCQRPVPSGSKPARNIRLAHHIISEGGGLFKPCGHSSPCLKARAFWPQ